MESELSTSVLTLSAESTPDSISVTRPVGTVVCLLAADTLAIVLALLFSSALRTVFLHSRTPLLDGSMLPTVVLTLCCFVAARLYPGVSENPVDELRRSVRATMLAFLSLWSATYFFHDLSQSRLTFLLACFLTIFFVPSFRASVRKAFAKQPWWGCPVAILGMGVTGQRVLNTLLKNPRIGLKPVAVLDDNPAKYLDVHDALTRGPLSRCLEITRDHRISYGIVCMPGLSRKELLMLLDRYGHCFGHVMVIPDLIGMASLGMCVRDVGGIIGLEVTRQLLRPSAQFAKRVLDLAITLAIAPLALLLIAFIAILIKLESAGPVFYANERIGYRGRRFKAWKLRSMVVDGDEALRQYLERNTEEKQSWEATQKLKRDPRITRVGRFLRKTSIDELPQFWNVLKGDMSVVGPRPFLESQVEMYGPNFELYKQVRPGITGLWQVSGRNHLTFKERVQLDSYVIQNWSVWMDIYILARTISVVLTANGAY